MQLASLFELVWTAVRAYPGAAVAFLLLAAALAFYYSDDIEAWVQAVTKAQNDPARAEVEALLHEDGSDQDLRERIHRWTGPAPVKALLLRKLRAVEPKGPFGMGGGGGGGGTLETSERTWIERVLRVPLGVATPPPQGSAPELLRRAKGILDRTLLGQNEVKLRLLEVLSSWLRRPEGLPPVLGLKGPPGVGKTTIARCVSEVLGRPCQTICFGGRKDSAELKGHSPTYVGAQWGALVQALVDARCMDPVLYLDEIDKIGGAAAFGGGGSEVYHVLLHATDPTQNEHFQDAYLPGIPIDLSRVLFVVSVNEAARLPKPLLDRIQWIEMEGYDLDTKFDILEKNLWDGVLRELGLEGRFRLEESGALALVEEHAGSAESGVRRLRQALETALRRAALLQDLRDDRAMLASMDWPHEVPEARPWALDGEAIGRLLHWKEKEAPAISS